MGGGTYPRATPLNDGSILGTFTDFEGTNRILTLVRSTNGGASWSKIGEAAHGNAANTDVDNPYVLQLPSGRILIAFRNHDKPSGTYTYFRITICYSDDGGRTWKFLSEAAHDTGSVTGNWEPLLRNAPDGTLQLYYSRENNGGDQDSLMRTSRDGGATWTSAKVISGQELNNARDGMLGVAVVSGSRLIAVFETETGGGAFHVGAVFSNDNGNTWGERMVVYQPSNGRNAQAPQVINVGGTLVASFQSDEDSSGQPAAKIMTSGDGGRTWGNKMTWSPTASNWAGLMTLDGGSFLAMTDHNGSKAQKITLS